MYIPEKLIWLVVIGTAVLLTLFLITCYELHKATKRVEELEHDRRRLIHRCGEMEEKIASRRKADFINNMRRNTADPAKHERRTDDVQM